MGAKKDYAHDKKYPICQFKAMYVTYVTEKEGGRKKEEERKK